MLSSMPRRRRAGFGTSASTQRFENVVESASHFDTGTAVLHTPGAVDRDLARHWSKLGGRPVSHTHLASHGAADWRHRLPHHPA